jgi:ferredoxin
MTTAPRLRVDPVACDGVGLCAQLMPDDVWLDRWGYPILDDRPLRGGDLLRARAAVRACPQAALWVEQVRVRDHPRPAR